LQKLSCRTISINIEDIKLITNTDIAKIGGALTFICTTGITSYYFIDNWIETKINSRIAPYEQLIAGIALVQDQEYDDAVEVLGKVRTSGSHLHHE
jgi:hypothetical protein